MNGTSRVTGDNQARFCERLGMNPRTYSAAVSDDCRYADPNLFYDDSLKSGAL